MAALTVQNITDTGAAPDFGLNTPSVSDTASIGTGGNTFAVYKNTNVSARTVTVLGQGDTTYGEPFPPKVLTLAATTGELWIPLRKAYDDGSGSATITLSDVTDVTVAVVRI